MFCSKSTMQRLVKIIVKCKQFSEKQNFELWTGKTNLSYLFKNIIHEDKKKQVSLARKTCF